MSETMQCAAGFGVGLGLLATLWAGFWLARRAKALTKPHGDPK